MSNNTVYLALAYKIEGFRGLFNAANMNGMDFVDVVFLIFNWKPESHSVLLPIIEEYIKEMKSAVEIKLMSTTWETQDSFELYEINNKFKSKLFDVVNDTYKTKRW